MYSVISNTPEQSSRSPTVEMSKPIVFIVDDDVSVRESLELLVRSGGWEPSLFESAEQFLDYSRPRTPCCLILDVNMPGLNGLELQRTIVTDGVKIPIIFITGFGDVPMTVRAMKAGAVEFLTKPLDIGALLEAVGAALAHSETVSREEEELALLQQTYGLLSPRERAVMRLVITGLLNKQIAFELGISEITVKAHRGQVMRKMNARSLPHLVNMAARLNLSENELIH
ncbi:response regulator transcription factor [Rhizobium sp. P32RR-XVIII]|uniref:response regulator transcription factor n=1 Tax=Rhizobium sp. P32RR-XVIII TaxID=2726738 RepID=UPI001456FF21|nr:response regulator transcription factor [Rhizobium sp. P32RR-XVIII]NLS06908.1 response regulator transcription factor [Rhizobium sp. P32RR-XVIII]